MLAWTRCFTGGGRSGAVDSRVALCCVLLAVNGGCPVMRGMFWAFQRFVVEFLEGLSHVARHGDIEVTFGIVPGEGEATVLCPFPIY